MPKLATVIIIIWSYKCGQYLRVALPIAGGEKGKKAGDDHDHEAAGYETSACCCAFIFAWEILQVSSFLFLPIEATVSVPFRTPVH